MKHIFYFFGIFAVIYELWAIRHASRLYLFVLRLRQQAKKEKGIDDMSGTQIMFIILHLCYIFWAFVGLFFSSQWIIFLTIVLFSFIPKRILVLRFIDSIISLALVSFVLMNQYHFGIDVPAWLWEQLF